MTLYERSKVKTNPPVKTHAYQLLTKERVRLAAILSEASRVIAKAEAALESARKLRTSTAILQSNVILSLKSLVDNGLMYREIDDEAEDENTTQVQLVNGEEFRGSDGI